MANSRPNSQANSAGLTELAIRNLASSRSFERGDAYYQTGAVLSIQKRGDTLFAEVEGNEAEPYEVTINLGDAVEADCSCPYDWGGYCKHVIAVLLTYIREHHRIDEQPSVNDLLAGLSEAQLRQTLSELLTAHPRLIKFVETQIGSSRPPVKATSSKQHQSILDPALFRHQAQLILDRHDPEDWMQGESIINDIWALIDKTRPFVDTGDGRNALSILEPVTEIYVERWYDIDPYGEKSADLFRDVGQLFAEAISTSQLSMPDRQALTRKLSIWQSKIEAEGGIEIDFDEAIYAAKQAV
ncbi:MAG: SWIM zinc finger family protein [Chloroflexota bacterium]